MRGGTITVDGLRGPLQVNVSCKLCSTGNLCLSGVIRSYSNCSGKMLACSSLAATEEGDGQHMDRPCV